MSARAAEAVATFLPSTSLTSVSQAEQDLGNLQNSCEKLCSESLMQDGASTTDGEIAECFRRLSAQEAMSEDLRNTLQDNLEQFRAELKDKLSHFTPNSFGTNEQNSDAAILLDVTKQELPIVLGDDLSQTIASVYAILQTEVTREVGQLRSFVKSEVQSLCSQFEMQSEKVEENVITVSKSEAANNWLSQCLAEIGKDLIELRERDNASRSELSKLRSHLEVVVRKCDEHTEEQHHQANQSAAFLSSLIHLENACQHAVAIPVIVREATESLRGELWQVVGSLREDVNHLKQANASIQRNDKKFGDLAELKDRNHLHVRLSDLEVALRTESPLVSHFEELLQKECVVVHERMNNLEGHLKELQVESWLERASAKLHKLFEEMRAEQARQITLAERRIARVAEASFSADVKSGREIVAGTIMPIISLESMMTRRLGSSKTSVAQSQVQSQVPMTVQTNCVLSSESHPAITHEMSPSLSTTLHTKAGISSAPKDLGRFLIWDGGGKKDQQAMHGSMRLPASRQSEELLQLTKATHAPQSSPSAAMPSREFGLDLRPSAFNGLASLHSVKEISPSPTLTACRVPFSSSTASSGIISSQVSRSSTGRAC